MKLLTSLKRYLRWWRYPLTDQHVIGMIGSQDVQILKDGVCSALKPVFVEPLLRRDHIDEFIQIGGQKTPTVLNMKNQAVRLVLSHDADAPNYRFNTVGKWKVDDAQFSTERHCGFATPAIEH